MPNGEKYDLLIVGQGLAGTVLARQLQRAGKKVLVVDTKNEASASRVAAGVWNPVVVKRFIKTWLTDEALPFAKGFYSGEERELSVPFFHPKPLLKILSNAHEREQALAALPELDGLVSPSLDHSLPAEVSAPEGGMLIEEAGYMDVKTYLDACRDLREQGGSFHPGPFSHDDLYKRDGNWQWQSMHFDGVVFCEGAAARHNPWLGHLPFRNTKGELIQVHLEGLKTPYILNKQVFVLPDKEGGFKVGATFHWKYDELEPGEKGINELLDKLKKILPYIEPTLLKAVAGERPTISDRRPVVGALKEPGLFVFNGLGSRGVLLAPYLADRLVRFMEGDVNAIPEEAQVLRFQKTK